jgi:serine/threonine protein kinase
MFAVIVRSCSVDYKEIKDTEIADCPVIDKEDIVIMDVEHVKNVDIYTFLEESEDFYFVIRKLLQSYKYLLRTINSLSSKNVVHFDMKPDNILIDKVRNVPIVIDFGLSLDINKILQAFDGEKTNIALLKNYFFTSFPRYYVWPLEVHYICYLLNKNSSPTIDEIERLCEDYVDGNEILNVLYSKTFVTRFKRACIETLKEYIGEKDTVAIRRIVENSHKTWDNYSLSVIMMNLLYLLNFDGFRDNKLMVDFSQLLITNIHPNYRKRLTIQETIDQFSTITYRDGIIHDSHFADLVNTINLKMNDFIKTLQLSTKHFKRLTTKLRS